MLPEEYWNQDIEHQDQKFYTAFCLLGAACSDYAIGVDLREQKKLNWSATALYYSLVHCGRLACFVALGDFPSGHEQLCRLFNQGHTNGQTWIRRNQQFFVSGNQIQPPAIFNVDDVIVCFQSGASPHDDLSASFSKWGQMLTEAKNLRNDSNYEGLLITHEYDHVSVTHSFEDLVKGFCAASETMLPAAILLMKNLMDNSQRREHWYAFLNWKEKRQGLSYLADSLLNKVNDRRALMKVTEFLSPLRRTPDQHPLLAAEVRRHVSVGVFEGKRKLMDVFKEKITNFEGHLTHDAPTQI